MSQGIRVNEEALIDFGNKMIDSVELAGRLQKI